VAPQLAGRDLHAQLRQPGIVTPQQPHLRLTAFDLADGAADALDAVLGAWWDAARRAMEAGRPDALTVTLGIGPRPFDAAGASDRRPVALVALPPFDRDALDPARCGGDLCLQACAGTPQAADAAVAALAGAAGDAVAERWTQRGTMPRRAAGGRRRAPRNLWGFVEGARNLRRPADLERHVWAGRGDRPWMAGGTYLVVRRIRLLDAAWDALGAAGQERAMGSVRATGAPAGVRGSHVDLASQAVNPGIAMLRRSYNFAEADGERGLVFCAFMRDPRRQFVALQRRLDAHDPLAATALHTGSAVFAIPPAGATPRRAPRRGSAAPRRDPRPR